MNKDETALANLALFLVDPRKEIQEQAKEICKEEFDCNSLGECFNVLSEEGKNYFMETLEAYANGTQEGKLIAINAIKELKRKQSVNLLIPLCFDLDEDVQKEAKNAIETLGYKSIKDAYADTSKAAREEIVGSIKLWMSHNDLKKMLAIEAITTLELTECLPELIATAAPSAAYLQSDKEMQQRAEEALSKLITKIESGKVGVDPTTVNELNALKKNGDQRIKDAVARVLEAIRGGDRGTMVNADEMCKREKTKIIEYKGKERALTK